MPPISLKAGAWMICAMEWPVIQCSNPHGFETLQAAVHRGCRPCWTADTSHVQDFVIFEQSSSAGSFFRRFPVHRMLISLNKRHTRSSSPEFRMRHDWNSLLGTGWSKSLTFPISSGGETTNQYSMEGNMCNHFNVQGLLRVQCLQDLVQMANGSWVRLT
eukprot:s3873_g8.t1